jgi:hypothetical protein
MPRLQERRLMSNHQLLNYHRGGFFPNRHNSVHQSLFWFRERGYGKMLGQL